MNFRQCIEKGLIKRSSEAKGWVDKEIAISRHHLENSIFCLENGMHDLSVVSSYTSMFHSARSLLFRDGYRERSHVCLVGFILSEYPNLKRFANVLDSYRSTRHVVLYGLEAEVTGTDAEEGCHLAKEFLEQMIHELDI